MAYEMPRAGASTASGQNRSGEVAQKILKTFRPGTLMVDGHPVYDVLTDPKKTERPWITAYCWTHWRRRFVKFGQDAPSPICDGMVARIAALYAIEKTIRGKDPDTRKAVRRKLSRPIVDALLAWLDARLQEVSSASELARHIRYGLKRRDGLTWFLSDGRLEMDTNGVEIAIRPGPLIPGLAVLDSPPRTPAQRPYFPDNRGVHAGMRGGEWWGHVSDPWYETVHIDASPIRADVGMDALVAPPLHWCRQRDSNPRPRDYKSRALPAELCRLFAQRDG